jgi:hypothetical protein
MLRWALRFLLIRVLPRRLFWFLSLVDVWFLLRSVRRRFSGPPAVEVNDPRRSRTAPPPQIDPPRPAPELPTAD